MAGSEISEDTFGNKLSQRITQKKIPMVWSTNPKKNSITSKPWMYNNYIPTEIESRKREKEAARTSKE